jgi:Ca-activated chloride channel family protein
MTFAWPHLLWLMLVPLAFLVWELTQRRSIASLEHTKILRAEAGRHSLQLTASSAALSTTRSRVRPWLWCGLIFGILALARPQWGRLEEPVFDQAREIIIAIDLSRSMLTPDVRPSRLDRAKLLTQSLLEKLQGERVGLIVFSGTAFLQSPLSADYEILREFLPSLNPDFLPEGGTNYGALIDTALGAFASTAAADRFLIVLSDGEATDDNWRSRLDELKEKGIRVIGLGVGTAAGAMIPDGSGGFVKDERGAVVLSKLESGTLRELAEKTNGVYQDASNWVDLVGLINSTVEAGRKGRFLEKNTVRLVERFQWPLALALWFLCVSFYYEFPVKPKPRELKLTGAVTSSPKTNSAAATTAAVTSILLIALVVLTTRGVAAEGEPGATQTPLLAKIVGRLSTAPQQTARDWSEFAHETATWGSRLQSSQQPVPEGPVRDALIAVDRGSQMDPSATDWSKLRQELEALLQKPPEQKKPDQKNQQDQQQQQNQDQQKRDQQKSDQQKQDSSNKEDQQKDSSPQDSKQQQSKPDDQQQPKQNAEKKENESAFGDMKDQSPPSPQEMQKVGGVDQKKETQKSPTDPALAIPLQKLEQLKNNDSPAELFKLMEGQKDQPQKKTKKDW